MPKSDVSQMEIGAVESFTLHFEITSAGIEQTIQILDRTYTPCMIIHGLNNGSLVTTTGYEPGILQSINETATGKIIAYIRGQDVDGEYEGFQQDSTVVHSALPTYATED